MKKFISSNVLAWLSEFSILIILGLTPVIFNYFYPTSIDLIKIVVFKIFTLLLLLIIIWRFSKFKLEMSKDILSRLLPFILLFIFLIVSLFFSVDKQTSWFGSYERQEGLISWLFYGLWTLLLVFHLGDSDAKTNHLKIRRLLIMAVGSSFLVSIYAIFQIFGLDFITWSEPANLTGRAISSFGQPNYLACWLLIILPFSAYLLYTTKNNLGRLVWLISFITGLGALLATGSRAAFLVFLIISVFWFFWFFTKKQKLSRLKVLSIILSGVVLVLSFSVFLAISNPVRFQELTDIKKGSAYVRLDLWKTGWQAFLVKPILGYGLENQKEAYVKYYKTDWAIYARPNTYSDRAHNLILDILLTSGLVGLGFFLYFLYWVYFNLLRAFKRGVNQKLAAFLIWSLTVYLVSLLFNFSVTVTNIYFWLIVGLSLVISGEPLFIINTAKKNSELSRLIIIASVIILFLYGSGAEIKRLEADYYFSKALVASANSDYFTALVLNNYINETQPDKITKAFYNQALALRFLENLPAVQDKSSRYVILEYLTAIESAIPSSNFENKFVKAFILGATNHLRESEKLFKDLVSLSPQLPKIYLAWGDVLSLNHYYSEAKVKFKQVLSLLPEQNNHYLNAQSKIRLEFYRTQVQTRLNQVKLLSN